MGPQRPPAVVLGLDCVTGLQTARLLWARGVPVIGLAADPGHYACRTRSCAEVLAVDPASPQVLEVLDALARRLPHGAALVPCTDRSVLLLSRHRDELPEGLRLRLPPDQAVRTLTDKIGFAEHAARTGLPTPATVVVRDRADVDATAALRFPVIVKPGLKTPAWEAAAGGKVVRCETPQEWTQLHADLGGDGQTLVVQEVVPGPDHELYSCNAYFDADGHALVTFVARKIRQWPLGQGTSTLGEEVRDEEVEALALRVLGSVPYRGLGYVEVKRSADTGDLVVIEPNVGRPTGRSAIAELGGVELLLTMYADMVGLPLPRARTQRDEGAKWLYLRKDLQAAHATWQRGELTPGQWVRSLRGVRHDAVWSWRDPIPFFGDIAAAAGGLAARRRQTPAPTTSPAATTADEPAPSGSAPRSLIRSATARGTR